MQIGLPSSTPDLNSKYTKSTQTEKKPQPTKNPNPQNPLTSTFKVLFHFNALGFSSNKGYCCHNTELAQLPAHYVLSLLLSITNIPKVFY